MLRKKMISGIGNDEPIPFIIAAIVAKQAEAMSIRITLMESQKSKVISQNVVGCMIVPVSGVRRKKQIL